MNLWHNKWYHEGQNITVSSLWNTILKIWDTLFELPQIETQWNKNYLIFFSNVQLGSWKGTLTWNKKSHAQNQQKNFFRDIWSVNNPIQKAAFFETTWFNILKRELYFFLKHFLQVYQKFIQNPVEHLRWSFLRKKSTAKKLYLRCSTRFWLYLSI